MEGRVIPLAQWGNLKGLTPLVRDLIAYWNISGFCRLFGTPSGAVLGRVTLSRDPVTRLIGVQRAGDLTI